MKLKTIVFCTIAMFAIVALWSCGGDKTPTSPSTECTVNMILKQGHACTLPGGDFGRLSHDSNGCLTVSEHGFGQACFQYISIGEQNKMGSSFINNNNEEIFILVTRIDDGFRIDELHGF